MIDDRINALKAEWEKFDEAWIIFSNSLKAVKFENGDSFDLSATEQQDAITYQSISERRLQCRDYIDSLTASRNIRSIPLRTIKRIITLVREATTYVVEANSKFEAAPGSGGLTKVDYEQFTISTADEVVKIDIGANYRAIFERLESVIYEYSVVSHFLKVEGTAGFYFRKNEVDRIVSQIDMEVNQVNRLVRELSETKKVQSALISQVRIDLDEINSAKDSVSQSSTIVQTELQSLAEKTARADEQIDVSSAVLQKAAALSQNIDTHKEYIDTHREDLETLRKVIKEKRDKVHEIEEVIAAFESQIAEKVADAESMLEGATVAGLAGQFGDIRDELNLKLDKAKNAVQLSAWLLLLSVVPILLYVFGPALGINTNGNPYGDGDLVQSISGLAMRSVLLIPATWYARFSARRHDRIFRLKEHYAYKYSLATAVEGFKKQAPLYKDDIAAETFFELTFNPADKLDQPKDNPQSRRESLVLKAIRERLNNRGTIEQGSE